MLLDTLKFRVEDIKKVYGKLFWKYVLRNIQKELVFYPESAKDYNNLNFFLFFLKVFLWTHISFLQIWNILFSFQLQTQKCLKSCLNCVTKCITSIFTPWKSKFPAFSIWVFQLIFHQLGSSGPSWSVSHRVYPFVCLRLCLTQICWIVFWHNAIVRTRWDS